MKHFYPETLNRSKVLKAKYSGGIEYDIMNRKMCLEYGSRYYHGDREERDELKRQICKEYKVRYVEIIESEQVYERSIEHSKDNMYLKIVIPWYSNRAYRDQELLEVADYILNYLGDGYRISDISQEEIAKIKEEAYTRSHNTQKAI